MVAVVARPKVPGYAPQPQQPSASEFTSWNQGVSNAKQNYLQTLAKNNLSMSQATVSNNLATRENAYNQANQRRGFSDSYVGRGIYHSGIYGRDLGTMLTGQYNQNAAQAMQYSNQMGGYQQANVLAGQSYQHTRDNMRMLEYSRRIDLARSALANQIKGIA